MESLFEVTIAINGYKTPELLRLCLGSIREHLPESGLQYEVLVADSETGEATEMLMREEFPEVRFFPHKANVGFKSLINTSLREAKGEYIFLINSDIILTKDTVPVLLTYLKTHSSVGLVGPKQFNFNGSIQQSYFRFYKPQTILYRRTLLSRLPFAKRHLAWFEMKDKPDPTEPILSEWLIGSALFVRREAALAVGPMDNQFFMYMEDVDWCRRFWEKGYQVAYHPGAIAYHYHAKGSAKGGFLGSLLFNKLTWYHIESAIRYFWKYRGKATPHIA